MRHIPAKHQMLPVKLLRTCSSSSPLMLCSVHPWNIYLTAFTAPLCSSESVQHTMTHEQITQLGFILVPSRPKDRTQTFNNLTATPRLGGIQF